MNYNLLVITACVLSLCSCKEQTIKTNDEQVPSQIATETVHEHDRSEELALNGTEKWKVVDKMMGFIKAIETATNETANTNPKDYKNLALLIDGQLDSLTTNCTMDGQAHDELHKWLVPFIDTSAELLEAENDAKAAPLFSEIQQSFVVFNAYFK